eukprot:5792921-Prymnesium_polylepis.1
MPELDALHIDAHRIDDFASGRKFASAHLDFLGYSVPGTESWDRLAVAARARGKELCVALRRAPQSPDSSGAFYCPTCAAVGRSTGEHSWFPDAAQAPRAWPSCNVERPPPPQATSSRDGIVVLTLHRVMDGAIVILQPGQPAPQGTQLTLRRVDGAAISFVRDNRPPEERASRGKSAVPGTLSFGMWGKSRGPDPLYEYDAFRRQALDLLRDDPRGLLAKPVCLLLLDQKLFNGVGNYLRAEILHRAGIPPFESSQLVLESALEAEQEEAQERDAAAAGGGGVDDTDSDGDDGGGDGDLLRATRGVLREAVRVPDAEWVEWL